MDILKAFEEYLPIWSEQKHLPIPTKKHLDKWLEAWKDFLSEYMIEHYNEISNEYRNMKYKSSSFQEDFPDIKDDNVPLKKSNWELVKEKRKKV